MKSECSEMHIFELKNGREIHPNTLKIPYNFKNKDIDYSTDELAYQYSLLECSKLFVGQTKILNREFFANVMTC